MAQEISIASFCDPCAHRGKERVPAQRKRVIAIDGPPRALDVCYGCDYAVEILEAVYQSRGQDIPDAAPATKAVRAKAKKPEIAPTPPPEEQPPVDGKRMIDCTLPHGKDGKSRPIIYSGRNSHASIVHQKQVWEIRWGDPEGILEAPCVAHKECQATGLAFLSKAGRSQHERTCPLSMNKTG